MSYSPQEGIDYITDLYAVVGIEQTAEPDEIKKALNEAIRQYHPDLLERLAPEFRHRGEQMARILNKARGILLDADKREEYDDILDSWDGLVSTTGTPAITITRSLQAELEQKSNDEIIAEMVSKDEQVDKLINPHEGLVVLLQGMVEGAGDDVPEDLLEQYEEALLNQDRSLAIKEAERTDILGLPLLDRRQFRAGLDYEGKVVLAIEKKTEEYKNDVLSLALGSSATRLALLTGETTIPQPSSTEIEHVSQVILPAYFEIVASQVKGIAAQRQTIVEKRLAIFRPKYPEEEAQQEAKSAVLIGIGDDKLSWYCATYNAENQNVDFANIPDDVRHLLDARDYLSVINADYNVMTFDVLEHIDLQNLLAEALDKYVTKYFPESLTDGSEVV